MHHHGAITIPEDELLRTKAMVKRTIAKPTLQTMDHLGGVFLSHRFMPFILHQLKLEPGFYAESDQMVFDYSGHNFKLCLKLKYQAKQEPITATIVPNYFTDMDPTYYTLPQKSKRKPPSSSKHGKKAITKPPVLKA